MALKIVQAHIVHAAESRILEHAKLGGPPSAISGCASHRLPGAFETLSRFEAGQILGFDALLNERVCYSRESRLGLCDLRLRPKAGPPQSALSAAFLGCSIFFDPAPRPYVVARSAVRVRRRHPSCADWMELDVAMASEEVPLRIHEARLVPPLPQGTRAPVTRSKTGVRVRWPGF